MELIDRYAYSNRIRAVDPAQKAGLALTVLLLCLALNEPAVGLLAVACMWALAACLARIPPATFGRVLLAEFFFLCVATAGVAVSVTAHAPALPAIAAWRVGPLWLSCSAASLQLAAHLITRTLGGTAAMNFLALTTPLLDLVDLLRRLRVPVLLIDVMTVMYRFIFILLESLNRMVVAQDSRLGYSSFRRSLASAGLLGSRLFVDAYGRSQRLQLALEARAYQDELRVLPVRYERDCRVLICGAAVISGLLLTRALV
jgi:cobalt/nickel transport system permease protein